MYVCIYGHVGTHVHTERERERRGREREMHTPTTFHIPTPPTLSPAAIIKFEGDGWISKESILSLVTLTTCSDFK